MKTLIIDNEKSIREGLKQMLATYCPKVVVAGEVLGNVVWEVRGFVFLVEFLTQRSLLLEAVGMADLLAPQFILL